MKEKVGKSNKAVYQTNLLDLFRTMTKICFQSGVAFDLIIEYAEKTSKNEDEKNEISGAYIKSITDFQQITHQLMKKSNGQDSILMVPGHSDLCCYLGNKCNHHVFEITEFICDIIRGELPANKLQQQDYLLTDLGTLHQETTNNDQELAEIIDELNRKDDWI